MQDLNEAAIEMGSPHIAYDHAVSRLRATLSALPEGNKIRMYGEKILIGCPPDLRENNSSVLLSDDLASILLTVDAAIAERTEQNINTLRTQSRIARGSAWCRNSMPLSFTLVTPVLLLIFGVLAVKDGVLPSQTKGMLAAIFSLATVLCLLASTCIAGQSSKPISSCLVKVMGVHRDIDIYLYQKINRLADALTTELRELHPELFPHVPPGRITLFRFTANQG